MGKLKDFQKLVITNASHVEGLRKGDIAPDFTLPDALGRPVTLSETLKQGRVIIKFYRGEWCPICNLDLRETQAKLPEIKSYGATILAISPQKPDDALTIKEKNALAYPVLSDIDQQVIKAYRLQFDPGIDYHNRRDLTQLNGDGSKTLPVPATFIVNSDRKIEVAHVEADYTQRLGINEILSALRKLTEM
ncbi:peroxiredoxin-like family protein [Pseudozobellia thermophila]|uniref:thioredoxin-dependent peroxiredoxin n=1 Tax=Pseudozobellia thermophila TaxID=192903 RepID=A0A1M6HL66_9FLAO|nr:peroxiredoxin-like family protein [Pseudozobellia thermophila]SHJ22958.1 Peroxiredoxin [Pseudozobellia thermophila]